MTLNYDYSKAVAYAHSLGLAWSNDLVEFADGMFKRAEFTQEQVEVAIMAHINHMVAVFNPKSYKIKGRIRMALHFLFGKLTPIQ